MEEEQPNQEQLRTNRPRIYVASLSDYNAGTLHGTWIDADQHLEDLDSEVYRMLSASQEPIAEEYAIHDWTGFGAFQLSEYESLDVVSRIAHGIAEHGLAFGHWANIVGTADADALDSFNEHYRGVWNSLADYAENLLDDLGETPERFGPAWLRPYIRIDYEQLGQDLSHDLDVAEDAEGVHVFEVRA